MTELPTGTVVFLFTDLEASSRFWQDQPKAMAPALARHDAVLRQAIEDHRGRVVKTTGDGAHAVFASATDAIAAAVAAQLALGSEPWPTSVPLRVRMGIHVGPAELRADDYYGVAVNRAARLTSVAHGGQIVISLATAEVAGDLPPEVALLDLGVHELRDVARPERVFQVVHPQLRYEFPRLRSLGPVRGIVVPPEGAFVGREQLVTEVGALLRRARVVALVGVGGVGKTRLALEVAARAGDEFGDGAWFVALAGVGDPARLDESLAGSLNVAPRPGATVREALLEHLRDKCMLIVLDNCEHLVEVISRFVEDALAAAPALRILVTSREGLSVAGERMVPVPVLGIPALDSTVADLHATDAVRLFVVRAAEAGGAPTPPDDEVRDIARLCRRLDGIPLAIELAAARRRSMTPAEILSHLDQRFRVLTGGRRTALGRHQTMRNAVDWSYNLLGADEQSVLHRLALFASGFDLTAVEAVVTGPGLDAFDVVDAVRQLVDKSLVVVETRRDHTRYRLFETIRDYAWEHLEHCGEVEEYSLRHARHFVAFAEEAHAGITGPDEAAWIERVRDETDNLDAALRWLIDVDEVDLALRLVAGLTGSASPAFNPFGTLAEQVAALPAAQGHELRPVALVSGAYSARNGEPERAVTLAEEGVRDAALVPRDAGHLRVRCLALGALGSMLLSTGAQPAAHALAVVDELGVLARRLGDDHLLATALNLASACHPESRLVFAEEALECAERTMNPSRLAFCLLLVARIVGKDHSARAHRLLEAALDHASSVGNDMATDYALANLSLVQSADGDFTAASATLVAVVERAQWSGNRIMVDLSLDQLARTLAVLGANDGALLIAEWLRRREVVVDTLQYREHTGGELVDAYERVLREADEEQRGVAAQRAESMTARDVLAAARLALAALPGGGRTVPRPTMPAPRPASSGPTDRPGEP